MCLYVCVCMCVFCIFQSSLRSDHLCLCRMRFCVSNEMCVSVCVPSGWSANRLSNADVNNNQLMRHSSHEPNVCLYRDTSK